MIEKKYCVYKVYDKLDDKFYIGCTWLNPDGTIRKSYRTGSKILQKLLKERPDTFVWTIINTGNQEQCSYMEKKHLEIHDVRNNPKFYNKNVLGHIHTPDVCKKIGDAMTGKKNYWYGKTFSDEHRAKMSAAKKGKKYGMTGEKYGMRGENHHNCIYTYTINDLKFEGANAVHTTNCLREFCRQWSRIYPELKRRGLHDACKNGNIYKGRWKITRELRRQML